MNYYTDKNKPIIEQNGVYYCADTLQVVTVIGHLEPMTLRERERDRYRGVRLPVKIETDIEENN